MFNILVADAECLVVEGIKKIFKIYDNNYTVAASAHDGDEALELLQSQDFDVMITDIRMPGIDGLELIKRAKEINPNIMLIIVSGYEEIEYYRKAIQGGVYAYILKPINIEEFIKTMDKVNEMLSKKKAEIETRTNSVNKISVKISSKTVRTAVHYIDENYNKNISLNDVAEHVYMHPVYFSQLFKNETGITFSEYLNNLRIEKAKYYLHQLEYKIKDIPQLVGFFDEKHFYKVFKKHIGVTPKEFRNSTL